MKKNFFLTGPPGSGKTSIVLKVVDRVREKGLKAGGIICPEVREGNRRVGFKIIDISNGKEGVLAWINPKFDGPKVGRYTVNLRDLDEIGVRAILESLDRDDIDLLVIDEIGVMELKSDKFADAVKKALDSSKAVLGVIHQRSRHTLLNHIRARGDTEIYTIQRWMGTIQRELLVDKITKAVLEIAGKSR